MFIVLNSLSWCVAGGGKELTDTKAGDREENKWLQYDSNNLPHTQQDWDNCVFVEKTHWGYYSWPRLFPFSGDSFVALKRVCA